MAVPLGASPVKALQPIRLVALLNDRCLRALSAPEMRTGFGWGAR